MTDPSNFRLRVYFRKTGRCALLSHLEVARALERAVRRAGLPYAISQGFSPHMKIAFGAALPVGVGGTRECFDLQMTRYIAPEKVSDALAAASVSDLMVTSCEYIGPRDMAASVAYPISTYRVVLSDSPAQLVVPDEITVIRKKKERVLRPEEFLVGQIEQNKNILVYTLHAKATGSLRPDVLLDALIAGEPHLYPLSVTRTDQRAAQ